MKEITKAQVSRVYNYLWNHHKGRENGIHASDLRKTLGIQERDLRRITHEINGSPDYPCVVSTVGSIYICASPEESERHIRASIRAGISLIRKAKSMSGKLDKLSQLSVEDMFRLECEEEDVPNQHI